MASNRDSAKFPLDDTTISSTNSQCAICLVEPIDQMSLANNCLHKFCFSCLKEWSLVKAQCPLCKQPMSSILHNVKSNCEYEEYEVPIPEAAEPDEEQSIGGFRMRLVNVVIRRISPNDVGSPDFFQNVLSDLRTGNVAVSNPYSSLNPLVPGFQSALQVASNSIINRARARRSVRSTSGFWAVVGYNQGDGAARVRARRMMNMIAAELASEQ